MDSKAAVVERVCEACGNSEQLAPGNYVVHGQVFYGLCCKPGIGCGKCELCEQPLVVITDPYGQEPAVILCGCGKEVL